MTATYEKIATTTVSGSSTSTITLNSISGAYTDLVVIINGSYTGAFDAIEVQANGDTGSNYSRTILFGNGSSAGSSRASNGTNMGLGLLGTENSTNVFHINNYSNPNVNKTFLARANSASNQTRAVVGLWRSNSAITSLTFNTSSSTYTSGTTFTLYGIKAA